MGIKVKIGHDRRNTKKKNDKSSGLLLCVGFKFQYGILTRFAFEATIAYHLHLDTIVFVAAKCQSGRIDYVRNS